MVRNIIVGGVLGIIIGLMVLTIVGQNNKIEKLKAVIGAYNTATPTIIYWQTLPSKNIGMTITVDSSIRYFNIKGNTFYEDSTDYEHSLKGRIRSKQW